MGQLASIFINVLVPVFALVVVGYVFGKRLGLEARTLSRMAYYILTPAFVFDVMSKAQIEAQLAARMSAYIIVVHALCVALAIGMALVLRRPAQVVAGYVLIAVFGNVGNFGVPIIEFALGGQARVATTVYFLAAITCAFIVSELAANWNRHGKLRAVLQALRSPPLFALPPALLVNWLDWQMPTPIDRAVGLVAITLIPIMLLGLGIQLAERGLPRLTLDISLSSAIRLLGGPLIAIAIAPLFDLPALERNVGIFQSSMPVAVFTTIIATENDLDPALVTGAVLFSTLASIVTLTLIIALAPPG